MHHADSIFQHREIGVIVNIVLSIRIVLKKID